MTAHHIATFHENAQGVANAKVTLLEYADYECPYCGEADVIVKALQKTFGASLRVVFRNFPLSAIHPHAYRAATFAEAAGAQGSFWPFHDMLFEHQEELSEAAMRRYAGSLGLNVSRLSDDADSTLMQERVDRDVMEGTNSGIQGTPGYVINGRHHAGSWGFDSLRSALERAGGVAA